MPGLFLPETARAAAWASGLRAIDAYVDGVGRGSVLPELDDEAIRALVATVDLEAPRAPEAVIAWAAEGLRAGQVHTSHPRYFGLFNPPSSTMGAIADALVAAFNPQLATRSHAPFPVEVEQRVLRELGIRFGFPAGEIEGAFTSGGAEANATALLCALGAAFPAWAGDGVRALPSPPELYASSEAHHSLEKAARAAGLGDSAVRRVATDAAMRMDPGALRAAIAKGRAAGRTPCMVVATCGTTSAGAIDPLDAVADVAAREGLWMHVDAAWGGFVVLVPELRPLASGVARADSITFDAHKSLAVPMGAGMYLSRRRGALARAFGVHAEYMPRGDDGEGDPYARSVQWSRRFIGLKLFMTLATCGFAGYADALRHEVALGAALRERIAAAGWMLKNDTPLPIVCFVDGTREDGESGRFLAGVARAVCKEAWISVTRVRGGARVLRACITNPATEISDVVALVDALGRARAAQPR
jgi:glutamate/tyrosine decarboxylase-like PLP-dependent enzyme